MVTFIKGYQLSWLERTPDKGEVPGSNPGWPKRKQKCCTKKKKAVCLVTKTRPSNKTNFIV